MKETLAISLVVSAATARRAASQERSGVASFWRRRISSCA
jgi:hypothetical protein